jgi:predicted TIM-barrel fold metal-dependent hydrolase
MKAIDVHVHVPAPADHPSTKEKEAMADYFGAGEIPLTAEDLYQTYKELDIFAVIFEIDAETTSGVEYIGNDYVASIVQRYPEQFMGFASVDPWKGKMAVQELERSVKELGLKGLKLHPTTQAFFPNDIQFYPLWEKAAELGIPVLFHSGQTGVGSGAPGGGGYKLKYAHPMLLDDVAADFPSLTIIMAHPAVPRQEEQLAVALHKGNVYIDLSGWSPKYFRPILVKYISSILKDKVMFGSDYPVLKPERWLRDFETLDLKEEVKQKILLDTAKKVLKL